jgi:hypothetical protein
VTPVEWLLARLTYRPSWRRISNYNTGAHQPHTVEEDPQAASQGQSVLLRKFDESERNRQQVDLMLQITPLETLTISPTGSYVFDDYLSKPPVDPAGAGQRQDFLGLQQQVGWTAGMDVGWAPHERVKLSLGYMHESYYRKMESRSRPVINGVGVDFSDYDWLSNITDTIDTLYGGVKVAVIPGVLDWGLSGSWAYALGTTEDTESLPLPVSGPAANNATATAKRFPAFDDELVRLETAVAYHFPFAFLRGWTAKLGYVFESWQKHDFRTDKLNPFIPGVSAVFLGDDLAQLYVAHHRGDHRIPVPVGRAFPGPALAMPRRGIPNRDSWRRGRERPPSGRRPSLILSRDRDDRVRLRACAVCSGRADAGSDWSSGDTRIDAGEHARRADWAPASRGGKAGLLRGGCAGRSARGWRGLRSRREHAGCRDRRRTISRARRHGGPGRSSAAVLDTCCQADVASASATVATNAVFCMEWPPISPPGAVSTAELPDPEPRSSIAHSEVGRPAVPRPRGRPSVGL